MQIQVMHTRQYRILPLGGRHGTGRLTAIRKGETRLSSELSSQACTAVYWPNRRSTGMSCDQEKVAVTSSMWKQLRSMGGAVYKTEQEMRG